MIKMADYEYIRYAYFNLKRSKGWIHRETGFARKTINRAIAGKEPRYRLEVQKEKPVIGVFVDIIKQWLREDQKVHKKQHHTARRIYNRLVFEHSFQGAESTVRQEVRRLKEELGITAKEGFIPSDPERREGCEVDWGEADVDIKGERTRVYMFCMRSKYSGKIFVKLYSIMLQECFFDGHIEAFHYFDGVFHEVVYDNLKSAVQKILTGYGRIEQKAFISFRSHYVFHSIFCNVAHGWEKGGVEGLVGYARRNFLTPLPSCDSLDQLNKKLLADCQLRDRDTVDGVEQSIGERFEQEKIRLLALPETPYNNYKLLDVLVDKYQTVQVKTNRYSVPVSYIGQQVSVELGLNDVRITYKNQVIAQHNRNYRGQEWILDPWHYLQTLRQKPRSYKSSRIRSIIETEWEPAVKILWDRQVAKYGEIEGTKEFLETIIFFQNKDYSDMIGVIELAIESDSLHQMAIKVLFDTLTEKVPPIQRVDIEQLPEIMNVYIPEPNLGKFDLLMKGENHGCKS